jgi:hypothetical protein
MSNGGLAEGVEFAENTAGNAYDALTRLKPPPEFAQAHAEMLGLTRALLEGFPPLVMAAKTGVTAFAHASSEQAERNTRLDFPRLCVAPHRRGYDEFGTMRSWGRRRDAK